VPDVQVIGHTDAVGSNAVNDPLSRQRADVVRSGLVARGVPADRIVASGRGKREPAVPTADGVAEPRNRRVEILVR
jgi:outer membrane protein OmpA-like peptidoglycan-associated protein